MCPQMVSLSIQCLKPLAFLMFCPRPRSPMGFRIYSFLQAQLGLHQSL